MLDFDNGAASDMLKVIEGAFIYNLTWSVGGCVDGEGRNKFDQFLRGMLDATIYETSEWEDFVIKNPEYVIDSERKAAISLPGEGLIYDYFFDCKTAKYVNWLNDAPLHSKSNEMRNLTALSCRRLIRSVMSGCSRPCS